MKKLRGDIWQLATQHDAIVIPTNIGYKKRDGKNVMGRGLARDAARRWPELAIVYGNFCAEHRHDTPIMIYAVPNRRWCRELLLFPVKPYKADEPWLSWMQPACPELIERHLPALAGYPWQAEKAEYDQYLNGDGRILVPTLGCGNGGLNPAVIVPMLERWLKPECFCLVEMG